jgi:hypothetical protein
MASTDDNINSTIIAAIVIGSTGVVLMVLGSVYYLTRLGDVPSRKAVGNEPEGQEEEEQKEFGGKDTFTSEPQQQEYGNVQR